MTTDHDDMADLFKEARSADRPGADLTARVLADAARVQTATAASRQAPRRVGGLSGLLGAIGGWPAVSGLAVAGVTGLMIGVYATDAVDLLLGGQFNGLWTAGGVMPGVEMLSLAAQEG